MADETAASATGAAAPTQVLSEMVKLRSSDGHLVLVDRSLLAAFSSVFRDMLEVVSSDEEASGECPVSESHEELQVLVNGLKGKANPTEADWLTLYKLKDKYDLCLQGWLITAAAEMIPKDPLAAYCAGAILVDRQIQEEAARAVLQKPVNLQRLERKIWEAAPEQERLRLLAFQKEWTLAGWREMTKAREHLRFPKCKNSKDKERCLQIWEQTAYRLIPMPAAPAGGSLTEELSDVSLNAKSDSESDDWDKEFRLSNKKVCRKCKDALDFELSDFRAEWKRVKMELSLILENYGYLKARLGTDCEKGVVLTRHVRLGSVRDQSLQQRPRLVGNLMCVRRKK